jgi:ABC-type Fe3+ transport system substrate-binding protein
MMSTLKAETRWWGGFLAIGACALLGLSSPAASADSKLIQDIVAKANMEGKLVATVQASWSRAMVPALIDAFKKRFGLTIEVSLTPVAAARQFPVEIASTRAGAPPTYDVMQGDDAETIQLKGAGGIQPIENWKELLAAINPDVATGKISPAAISPGPYDRHGFLYMANDKQIVYNPRLIKADELPKTHPELADAKYKGKFVQPPWTSHWSIAPQLFEPDKREAFLDIVRAAGKNSVVLPEADAVQRVVLGQYAFALAQDTFVRTTLDKDPQAPIGYQFFTDYNARNSVYYLMRARARSPAASILFIMWMTTGEAQAIWQPSALSFQPYGLSALDQATREALQKGKIPVVGYADNEKTLALLTWQQTPEGAKYLSSLAQAIQGR